MTTPTPEPYFRPPGLGPDCSTPRSARLRERRFTMGYEQRTEPDHIRALAEKAQQVFLALESDDPALARARALRCIVDECDITIEDNALLLGGEDPFFLNMLLPALQADRHSREGQTAPTEAARKLREASVYYAACFEGHITPGLDDILSQGVSGIRARVADRLTAPHPPAPSPLGGEGETAALAGETPAPRDEVGFWQACLESLDAVLEYARRYADAAEGMAEDGSLAAERREELREAARVLRHVPENPARTLHEALQSYWLVYILVTLEIGGCCPGGGLGLGRMDQYLYPYYEADLREGRLTREQALELLEIFLLGFRHVDYYTGHQMFTPGSQGSLGGVTPAGMDAANDLSELIMEASLRIAMPAPYLSLRLHKAAPERYWQAASDYIVGGLGFPIVNDEVLVPAFLRHGRSLEDARDYICSCCYENTIPGREAFHPNGCYLNLPFVLELALNEGKSLLTGEQLGLPTPPAATLTSFEDVLFAFMAQLTFVTDELVGLVNAVDESHTRNRRYPLMSCFIDNCIAEGRDVCAGGAQYDLTGCIVAGLPNVVNGLEAVRTASYPPSPPPDDTAPHPPTPSPLHGEGENGGGVGLEGLVAALRRDFDGDEELRRELLRAPKWGNGEADTDALAALVTEALYERFRGRVNARGGRWQLALYSFAANHTLGAVVGASADGRRARDILTRNLNPTWGTDRHGPTGVLRSLSAIDFTKFPDGCSLDLRFDPGPLLSAEGRHKFAGFLKGFVELGVMQMQISMVDAETLLDARAHPERYPHLMVKVAGYSARFVDLPEVEKDELIGRTTQKV